MRLKVSLRMVGGSMIANLTGGVVGGTYNAFHGGNNKRKHLLYLNCRQLYKR